MTSRVRLAALTLGTLGTLVVGGTTPALATSDSPSPSPSASASATPSSVDPALVTALHASWLYGTQSAWRSEGGTLEATWDNPGSPYSPHEASTTSLDVAKHRTRQRESSDGITHQHVIVGRTKYNRTPPELRAALRLHHVHRVHWTSTKASAAGGAYKKVSNHGRGGTSDPAGLAWESLSASTDAQGYTTYTGTYRSTISNGYTPDVVIRIDPQNRPVSWDESGLYRAIEPGAHDATATSHQTWQWGRPHLTAKHAHNAVRAAIAGETQAQRAAHYIWLYATLHSFSGDQGATAASVQHVALTSKYHARTYRLTRISDGIKIVHHAAGHSFTWEVVVHGDRVIFKPTHN